MAGQLLKKITAEDIERFGVVAAPDTLTGTPQENKAIFDRLIREMVAAAFNLMVDEVNILLGSEENRENQENERVDTEEDRVEAELLREDAEALRKAAEEGRGAAELERVAAELARKAISAQIIEDAQAEADRAKWEADRAGQIVGGDFVTHLEHSRDLAEKAPLAIFGEVEKIQDLEPGGILFLEDGEGAEAYAISLEGLLLEAQKAAEGKENTLAEMVTVQLAESFNLRSNERGDPYTQRDIETLAVKLTDLCREALAGGAYVTDGVVTLTWKQVQGYIIDGILANAGDAEKREFSWCYGRQGELEAIRQEQRTLRALVGELNNNGDDQRFLPLSGGTLEPTSKIAQTNGQWSWELNASTLTFANKQPDGVEYYRDIGADYFGWGSNEIANYIYESMATLGSVSLLWDYFGNLSLGVTKLDGIPTVTDADKDSPDYAAQNSEAASVGYVRAALASGGGSAKIPIDDNSGIGVVVNSAVKDMIKDVHLSGWTDEQGTYLVINAITNASEFTYTGASMTLNFDATWKRMGSLGGFCEPLKWNPGSTNASPEDLMSLPWVMRVYGNANILRAAIHFTPLANVSSLSMVSDPAPVDFLVFYVPGLVKA